MSTPASEIELSVDDVRELLRVQHVKLSHLPLTQGPVGWDNAMFRLGEDLAVRLPRRQAAAGLIDHEQRWLPLLAPRLPLPIPVPIAVGLPQGSFPWRWSVTPWFRGQTVTQSRLDADQVDVLAQFLEALHVPAPADAPYNPWRSGPLGEYREAFERRVRMLSDGADVLDGRLLQIWEEAARTPIDTNPTWFHGDLHPGNVLVDDARLCAVIDWGDMARGDRACDLGTTWTLLPDADSRERMMSRCRDVSADTWKRARGWALHFAVNVLSAKDPQLGPAARLTLQRLREGP